MVARKENGGQKDCAQMWFGPDFRGSIKVQAMSWAEQGMYRHLLDLAWENGGIPSDLDEVRGILRLSPEEFTAAWKRVGRCFVPHPDDPSLLINDRQERERAIRADIRRKRAEAGDRGRETQREMRHADQPSRKPMANATASATANGPHVPSQNGGLSPSPPPSPSQSPFLPRPAGPEVLEPSSCCTSPDQQDDSRSDSGPAGPGRTKQQRELFEALRATSFAKNSRDRDAELTAAAARLDDAGIEPRDLITLAHKAARRGKQPGGLFAHWMRNTPEALKELGKR